MIMKKYFALLIILVSTSLCLGSVKENKSQIDAAAINATGDGIITMYRPDKDERITIHYKDNEDRLRNDELAKLNYFFRCRLTGEVHDIDPKLIHILDMIQDHFGAKELKIISQYRSPTRNAMMRREGRGVAKNSLHMQGMAADIEIDGVPASQIRDYAYSLKRGGTGFYGNNSFIHVDTGRVRTWGFVPTDKRAIMTARKTVNSNK